LAWQSKDNGKRGLTPIILVIFHIQAYTQAKIRKKPPEKRFFAGVGGEFCDN
jgi:hypothetical protein